MSSVLHTFHDGSILRIINAKDLITIPVWKGNRIIDYDHVNKIKMSIGTNVKQLDRGYVIVTCPCLHADGHTVLETYLVDGQHRHAILKDYFKYPSFEDDFPILVTEKALDTESDIIDYFNTINFAKPLQWEIDHNLIVNEYITALESAFNIGTGRKLLIKKGNTYRPYLSVEKLREGLLKNAKRLKPGTTHVNAFIVRVQEWNLAKCASADIDSLGAATKKDSELITRASKMRFMLAIDKKLGWISACLV